MEDTSKQQLLRYPKSKTPENPRRLVKNSYHSKILPHIIEEYNYRITNYLLIKKIISPKRDKTIMSSLQAVQRHRQSAGHLSRSAGKENRDYRGKESYKTASNSRSKVQERGQSNARSLVKAVSREGKIAHRPLSEQKSQHYATQISSVISNNLITDKPQKSQDFTHLTSTSKQDLKDLHIVQQGPSWKQRYSMHGFCFKNHPSGYGHGPTILLLNHLLLQTNPQIKAQTLIQLELVQRAAFSRAYFDITYSKVEKTIKTDPFRYSELPKDSSSSIKFCIRALKIGDFVPLRIWKYNGVESILVGTVDLPLSAHEDTSKTVALVRKKSDDQQFRKVFNGEVKHRLLTNKMFESQSVAHVRYRVYPKRFRKRDE